MTAPLLEIAVTSPAGAALASDAGADRVELCSALELGGITPSIGLLEATIATGVPVHVLIRCRAGSFVFDEAELAIMTRDAIRCLESGAAGVVVGALTAAGTIDAPAIARLVEACRSVRAGAAITFHRAVDQLAHPSRHVAELESLGIDRILTSGGAAAAPDAVAEIAAMVAAAGRVEIMAGGGVTLEAIPALIAAGVHGIHLSAKKLVEPSGGWVSLGVSGGETSFVTDPTIVTAARAAIDAGTIAV